MWSHSRVIPEFEREKRENHEFAAGIGYIGSQYYPELHSESLA